jgi:hypothetical protein
MNKIAVIGSRTFNDYKLLETTIDNYTISRGISSFSLVSGGARGADKLAEWYSTRKGKIILVLKADWGLFGKSAGFRRNLQVISNCTEVIAFWDGKSKGTAHAIELAKKQNKPVTIVYFA